jgi:hypothetical protein
MINNRKYEDEGRKAVGVELKYCEHCGGLWFRERGTGGIYCDHCQPIVAELPPAKKHPGRVALPTRPRAVVDDYEFEIPDPADDEDPADFDAAAGGAA